MKRMLAGLAAGLVIMGSGPAQAVPIMWSLDGVVFDDGGTAMGSFIVDADAAGDGLLPGVYSDINVTTVSGGVLEGRIYDAVIDNLSNVVTAYFVGTTDLIDDGRSLLFLRFMAPLTNAGGRIDISGFPAGEGACQAADCLIFAGARFVTDGSVVGTPVDGNNVPLAEPGTLALVLTGFGVAAMIFYNGRARRVPVRRRRR